VDPHFGVSLPADSQALEEIRGLEFDRPIHHDTEGALGVVMHEQHHRPNEIRILKLRHRNQQL
jgi:hypothetical protein